MSPFSSEEVLTRSVRSLQMIVGSLTAGLVIFLAIALSITQRQGQQQPVLAYVAAGFTAVVLVARAIVPGAMAASQRKQIAAGTWAPLDPRTWAVRVHATDGDRLLSVFTTKTIIEGALLESPGFVLLLAYICSAEWWLLAIVALLLALMVLLMPTRDRVDHWVQHQLELMELERQ